MGWLMFYAGVTKMINPQWSAGGYLASAKTFSGFYGILLRPEILPLIDFVNEWGLTLLGASLILGIGVRTSSLFGAILMLLYYFPILDFPYPNAHSFIVDEHIIYAAVFLLFAATRAGKMWSLSELLKKFRICEQSPLLRSLLE